ncbi:hypothetical protein GGTG_03170 [Gaeumannomyces tritici R3-111a-1]|uniref:Uncharacterized protein n=1 Tax=Gaeumannomyces tritici (strain R3-111a-1) TaxID=644352 RepID=J3NPG2_GAET3|nr:hypothetical protein GGTG_03170 [Gaeumannomyces tritici R3-111a-1]EJT78067.1 hypothetical protein GGTG_03170 [Gaeumannomyces tritici R3-111a-1]
MSSCCTLLIGTYRARLKCSVAPSSQLHNLVAPELHICLSEYLVFGSCRKSNQSSAADSTGIASYSPMPRTTNMWKMGALVRVG